MRMLENKVAVVTGGNSGIGLSIAKTFVAEGASVLIVGRRQDAVDKALAELGPGASGVVGDIRSIATHQSVAATVEAVYGKADIYVANAGMSITVSSADALAEQYDEQFQTNTRAVFFGVQTIAPVLREGASIIVTSSVGTRKAIEGSTIYTGTKAAIEAFSRNWALEFKDRKIRVNVLSPGPTDTPLNQKVGLDPAKLQKLKAELAENIPLGRMGEPEDLAKAAVFLASDMSSFITGVNLLVDGGHSLT